MRTKPIILDRKYDFYKMSNEDRIALVGKEFQEKVGNKIHKSIYFPVLLSNKQFNYGYKQGLIFVSPVWSFIKTNPIWFRVGVSSPDDLDNDLDFEGDEKELHKLRKQVIRYVRAMNKTDVTYYGMLEDIQKHFPTGVITS